MHTSVIAIVLCFLAAAAGAECVGHAPVAGVAARPGSQLIKTSAAGTHGANTPSEQALPADDGLPVLRETAPAAKAQEEHPRNAGPAMLLAAVAVMSGIALRRLSARS